MAIVASPSSSTSRRTRRLSGKPIRADALTGVAFDARYITHQASGIGQMGLELLRGLLSAWPGPSLTVLANADTALPGEILDDDRVSLASVPWSPLGVVNQLRLPRLLRREGVRLLHSVDSHLPVIGSRVRHIVHLHDVIPLTCERSLIRSRKSKHRRLWKAWLKLQCWRADRIITGSRFAGREIVETLGLPEEKISVIPTPVRTWKRTGNPWSIRRRLGLKKVVLSSVGRPEPYKNSLTLIRALPSIMEKLGTRAVSLVVGGFLRDNYPEAVAEVSRFGLGEHVVFPGYTSERELGALYRASDVFIFPSLHEGFGLPPLEAMSFGVPVVASNRSCLPEVLARSAHLVDTTNPSALADGVVRILCNEALRSSLVRAGHSRARCYSMERLAHRYLRLYESVLSPTRQTASK